MKKAMKPAVLLLALLVLVFALLCAGCGSEPKEEEDPSNPIVLKLDGLELTKYYFDNLYATNSNYYRMSQGAISMSDYFDLVTVDLERYAVTLKAAREKNYTLTAEDEAAIEQDAQSQWEYIRGVFLDKVDASITDQTKIEEEFERLFQLNTGYSSALYRECLAKGLRDRAIVQKLFEELTAGIEPSESQIRSYIDLQINKQSQIAFSTFAEQYRQYASGSGDPCLFVPQDCFSVSQLLIKGSDALTRAREIDRQLAEGMSTEELLSLAASEENDDENMALERFRAMGYLIHPTLIEEYTTEFYCAAYAAQGTRVIPGVELDSIPEYETFSTTEGKKIIKVTEEDCVRYITVNRTYLKGSVSYRTDDDIWKMGYEGAKQKARQASFDETVEQWHKKASEDNAFTWYFEKFRQNYLSSDAG